MLQCVECDRKVVPLADDVGCVAEMAEDFRLKVEKQLSICFTSASFVSYSVSSNWVVAFTKVVHAYCQIFKTRQDD